VNLWAWILVEWMAWVLAVILVAGVGVTLWVWIHRWLLGVRPVF
jgi:hypothetical protein